MHDFPVYDFTQEQNGSLHFSSLVGHCKWQSVKKVFSSRKFATIAWLRAVLSVISSSQNYYLQSQHGAEPVEDRRTLHVTLPGVNCTPFKLSSFTVMDWTLSVILLTSAMFKLDEACGEVVLPINPSLSSFSMLFNFTETGEGLVEISSSFTQILGTLFSSGWPLSKMDSSICEVNLCFSVMWLCSCFSENVLENSWLLFEFSWFSLLAGVVWRLCRIFRCSSSVLKVNDTGLKSFVEVFPTLISICDAFLTARWEEESEDGLATMATPRNDFTSLFLRHCHLSF